MRRGRFAPTPSGELHIGNARTALLAWLHMRSVGGHIVFRLEDIDVARSRREFAERIMLDLRWLGLDWDEGPDIGGPHAPYEQSKRGELYAEALSLLERAGRVYPCYCSRAELAAIASAPHGLASEGPAYPGTCRTLDKRQREVRSLRKQPSLRFAVDERRRDIELCDGVMGEQRFCAQAGGDFVVKRADGVIAYQLAVVVDDAAMGITDVLRGADLLDSTPRQWLLYEALDYQPPQFAHAPLVAGTDGERLSKRHGSISIASLRRAGVSRQRIVGYLAYTCGLIGQPESLEAAELIAAFDLSRIPRTTVVLEPRFLI